jgi:hypothetical protein
MQPIEKFLTHLPDHKRSGKGFKACCPAHEDRNPSLSISEADDGSVLLKCFAGCTAKEVVAAMGLEMADLFPAQQEPLRLTIERDVLSAHSTVQGAIRAYGRGEPDQQWIYTDASGNEAGRTLRWNTPAGKEIRPLSRVSGGWKLEAMAEPRPLLNLPALLADTNSPVYVVEGEKCVDVLMHFGFLATTSAGGSQAARLTDWTPLANRRVIVLPDNDEAGVKYADDVRGILGILEATVSVAELDGRPPAGGDVADLLAKCTCDDDRTGLREEIAMLPNDLEPLPPPAAVAPQPGCSPYQRFPTESLPAAIRTLVNEAARSIGCDEAVVALPALSSLGVAAANWRLAIKDDWVVPPAVWTIIARPSGRQKSPALDVSLDYFRQRQEDLGRQHGKGAEKDEAARPKTIWSDNATTEGLDEAFKGNPRGILYGCDELSGWLGTFGLYKNGRSASDEGWYCQRYGGRASHIVRKKNGPQHGCASGMLAVTGCTTVDTLRSLLTRSVRECGLMARLVICIPPESKRRWSASTVSAASRQRYYSLLDRLFEDDAPKIVRLSPEAKKLFREFFDSHNEESEQLPSDDLKPAFSKLEELPARLALILHVAEGCEVDVTGAEMARAISVVEWAKREARRAYTILQPPQPEPALPRDASQLLQLLARKGPVSVRQAQAGCRAYRASASQAKAALDSLVAGGHARQTADGAYARVELDGAAATPTPPALCPSADMLTC